MDRNTGASHVNTALPPRLIPAFTSGFNAVTNHISLILLPIFLDILLWFGPHLRLKTLGYPIVLQAIESVRATSNPQSIEMLTGIEEIWQTFLERYNLFSSLSTFPLGVPSLMAGQAPLNTPMGISPIYEMNSLLLLPLSWLLLTIVGLFIGCLYLSFVARACRAEMIRVKSANPFKLSILAWQAVQLLILVIFLLILAAILFLPTLVISSILVLVAPILAWVVLLGMSMLTIWIIIPLAFSPHGIFAFNQNAINAALNSARVVRFFLPGTGLFVLASVVLYQGMGLLWSSPPASSWLALIGIAGHAFIATGLVASSFAYYFSALNWVQSNRRPAVVSGESS